MVAMAPHPPHVRIAFLSISALTPAERGLVLCWFCDTCRRYVGPGDTCRCDHAERERQRHADLTAYGREIAVFIRKHPSLAPGVGEYIANLIRGFADEVDNSRGAPHRIGDGPDCTSSY